MQDIYYNVPDTVDGYDATFVDFADFCDNDFEFAYGGSFLQWDSAEGTYVMH